MRAAALVEALKRTLKAKGLTYADVAGAIALSEASVKRMFARGDFTLQRLEEICRFEMPTPSVGEPPQSPAA